MKLSLKSSIVFLFVFLVAQPLNAQLLKKLKESTKKKEKNTEVKEEKKTEVDSKLYQPDLSINYTDAYGISGVYYFSRPTELNGKKVEVVNIEYTFDTSEIKMHYDKNPNVYWKGFTSQKRALITEYKYISFSMDHMNKLAGTFLAPLEPGIYYDAYSVKTDLKLDCSEPKYDNSENKILLIGKDKTRMEEILADANLLEELVIASMIKECEVKNIGRAAKYPMPAPKLKDNKLEQEALKAIKEYVAKNKWSETIEYCYIKDAEWSTIRDRISGVVLGRVIYTITVLKTSSGKCKWQPIQIRQNYDGQKFGASFVNGNMGLAIPSDCAEAMKYKK